MPWEPLTDDQLEIRDLVRTIARDRIAPRAAEIDESHEFPWDVVELSRDRACVGRLFFRLPDGIRHGQYWLNVKFQKSLVRVPFRILTKDEEELLSDNFKDIRKQVQDAFTPNH